MVLFANLGLANSNESISVHTNENQVNLPSTVDDFKTCTTTIKGTINGQEIDIDVTFEAENCAVGTAKILKEAMKE
jgi:hypothetical protein